MASFKTLALTAAFGIVNVAATSFELPPCLNPFQPFVYSGCFSEQTSGDSPLIFRSEADQNDMTVEECVESCKGNGFRYAGLTYYGVCFCGQTVDGPQLEEEACNYPCSGDNTEMCGGDKAYSIYSDPSFLPVDETPDFDHLGCYTDDSDHGRALVYRQDQLDSATLTTEICLDACHERGFPFAGTEFGGECYCGVVIANGTTAAAPEECNVPCNGDDSQTCGGPARISLYVSKELQSLEPCGEPTPTETPTPTDPVCTATVTVPPTCEYKCGNWCAHDLPDWEDEDGCKKGHSSCKAQVASCFRNAGYPGVNECWDFANWCKDIESYCSNDCGSGHGGRGGRGGRGGSGHHKRTGGGHGGNNGGSCGKKDCFSKKKPRNPSPPTTTVTTYPCEETPTTPAEPPVPTETICVQPSNWFWGYGPENPVGGIDLPVVTCNNVEEDFEAHPFKMYTEGNTRSCPRYGKAHVPSACEDACREQKKECLEVYAEGCKTDGHSKRTWNFHDPYAKAKGKCEAQFWDCKLQNAGVTAAGMCESFEG